MLLTLAPGRQLCRPRRRTRRRHGDRRRLRGVRVDCDDARGSGLPRPRARPPSARGRDGFGAARTAHSPRRDADGPPALSGLRFRGRGDAHASRRGRLDAPAHLAAAHVRASRRPAPHAGRSAAPSRRTTRRSSAGTAAPCSSGRSTAPRTTPASLEGDAEPIHYCLGREGRLFDQIGPVVAGDDAIAQALVSAALAAAGDRADPARRVRCARHVRGLAAHAPASGFSGRCTGCGGPGPAAWRLFDRRAARDSPLARVRDCRPGVRVWHGPAVSGLAGPGRWFR